MAALSSRVPHFCFCRRHFGALVRFFPPVVTGSLVTIIGITLVPVALHDIAGGVGAADYGQIAHISLGFGVLTSILIVYRMFQGFARSIAVLIGLLVGTIVAVFQGNVTLTPVFDASWFHFPEPFYFGTPTFHLVPIVTMLLVVVIGVVEAAGVYLAISDICGTRLTKDDIARGYRAEGIAIVLGGVFNAFPYTTYSQNVGLVQLSGVRTSRVVLVCGMLLITLGMIPKIAALTMIIPKPVMGGAMLAMFGLVMAYGIKMLARVDFEKMENLLIVGCSVGMGLGVTVVPQAFEQLPAVKMVPTNGIVVGSFTALVLNLFFHGTRGKLRQNA